MLDQGRVDRVDIVDVDLHSLQRAGHGIHYPCMRAMEHGEPGGVSSTNRWPSPTR